MKIILKIFLIISVILFLYTFYNSEIKWGGIKRDYFAQYYIFSIILILYSTFILFLKKNIKIYFLIINVCVVLSLYISEFLLIKYKDYSKYKSYKENTGKNFDKRTNFEFYKDKQKTNKDISVLVYPDVHLSIKNEFNIFPFSGVANTLTIQCNENGYYSLFESDRYGFNNPDKEWDEEEIEYLLIGDSLTQGECVNRPYDIGSNLRKKTNKNVINLGYGSTGTLIQFATFIEYYKLKKFKKLIWFYYEGNDTNNLINELENEILKSYIDNENFSQNLINRQKEIDIVGRNRITQSEEAYYKRLTLNFINFLKLKKTRRLFFKYSNPRIDIDPLPIEEFKYILSKTKEISQKIDMEFYFVYFPDYYRYSKYFNEIDYDKKITLNNYEKIKQITNSLNIKFIDLHENFHKLEKDPRINWPFKQWGHYTPNGYEKVTEKILEYFKNEKI